MAEGYVKAHSQIVKTSWAEYIFIILLTKEFVGAIENLIALKI